MRFLKTLPRPAILLVFVPVSIFLSKMGVSPVLSFCVSAIAIIGLISIMSKSTDQVAIYSGAVVGGLLNATFGNFPELVISLSAIRHGMETLVIAALTGSIIGNILLVVGLSMFFGGLKYKTQKFSRTGINASVLMLVVALFALIIPSFVHYGFKMANIGQSAADTVVDNISICTAIVLLVVYMLYLVFSLKTHRSVYGADSDSSEKPDWGKGVAIAILFISALLVAFESDIFVDAIEGILKSKNSIFSELFMGVIFVAAIGNAVAMGVSVNMARKNKMDLAFGVSMGASIQVALLIAPLLVLYSFLIKNPLTLVFNGLELIAIWASVLISGYSLLDGESNWFEGAMFVAIYVLVAIAFFFHP